MPTQTKAQLLNQNEVLKHQNASQIEEIANLRRVNKTLTEKNWQRFDAINKLEEEVSTVRAQFAAYKQGAHTFQTLAQEEIKAQALELVTQKINLLNSLTATVYGQAKKEAGV